MADGPLSSVNPDNVVPNVGEEKPDPIAQSQERINQKSADLQKQENLLMEMLSERGNAQNRPISLGQFFSSLVGSPESKYFSQSMGDVSRNLQGLQEAQRKQDFENAKMRMELGRSQLSTEKELLINKLGANLMNEQNQINPNVLRQMTNIDPAMASKFIEAQKNIKSLLEPKTMKLGNEETLLTQNPDGTWKATLSGAGKTGFEERLAMRQLNIDPMNLTNLSPELASKLQTQIKANKATIDTDINEAMTLLGIPLTDINNLNPQQRSDVEQKILAKARAKATKVTVNQEIEKELFKTVGKGEGERLLGLRSAADSAESLINSSNRNRELLATGKVITGPFAGITLQANRLAGDPEKVRATQAFLNEQSKATLAAIKSSGLGSGQGFTDKDRIFLQEATSGQVTWDRQSLERLADLNELAARNSINKWNDEFSKIEKSNPAALRALPTFNRIDQPVSNPPKDGNGIYILSKDPRIAEIQAKNLPANSRFYGTSGRVLEK
jgi:hypothetical protein